jgi:hypothetical protein
LNKERHFFAQKFGENIFPGSNPTIVSYSVSAVKIYNASAVKIYNATSSPVILENKNIFI